METCCKPNTISIDRILSKYDSYISKNDTASALRHLEYWEREISIVKDDNLTNKRSLLTIENELIGMYRQLKIKEKADKVIASVLSLIDELDINENTSVATIYTNIATAYKVFEEYDKALYYYNLSFDIYNKKEYDKNTYEYASLLNNYALVLIDTFDYDNANNKFLEAIDVLNKIGGKDLEIALTYLNIATLIDAKDSIGKEKEIDDYLEQAKTIFDSDKVVRNSYYAYVCDKAASVYSYFGYFLYAKELRERRDYIYERARTS